MTQKHDPRRIESRVIAALLLEPQRAAEALSFAPDEDFAWNPTREAFSAMRRLERNTEPWDASLLAEELERSGQVRPERGWASFLSGLMTDPLGVPSMLREHLRIVRAVASLRDLRVLSSEIARLAEETDPVIEGQLEEALNDALAGLARVQRRTAVGREETHVGAAAEALIQDDAPVELEQGVVEPHLVDLQKLISTYRPGSLVIFAGATSHGKSAWLASGFLDAIHRQRRRGLYVSFEMEAAQVVSRNLASMTDIENSKILNRRTNHGEREVVASAARELAATDGWVEDSCSTITQLESLAHRAAIKNGIEFLVVDYLQRVRVPGAKSRFEEVSEVARRLKNLARELRVPVLTAAQLSREGRRSSEPDLTHLRETGDIEQEADAVVLFWPKDADTRNLEAEPVWSVCWKLAKQRGGATGRGMAHFFRPSQRVVDAAPKATETIL